MEDDDIIREGDLFNAKFDDGTEYFNRVCKKDENWNGFINCLSKTKVYTKVLDKSNLIKN